MKAAKSNRPGAANDRPAKIITKCNFVFSNSACQKYPGDSVQDQLDAEANLIRNQRAVVAALLREGYPFESVGFLDSDDDEASVITIEGLENESDCFNFLFRLLNKKQTSRRMVWKHKNRVVIVHWDVQ